MKAELHRDPQPVPLLSPFHNSISLDLKPTTHEKSARSHAYFKSSASALRKKELPAGAQRFQSLTKILRFRACKSSQNHGPPKNKIS
jgi:hypothetical protein